MSRAYPKALISITSIPRRFENSLREVIDKLEETGEAILVCIPSEYRKWGAAEAPAHINNRDTVTLFKPAKDHGPATKLLGALEYLESARQKFDAIITLDDDIYYEDPAAAIRYFKRQAMRRPGCVITVGGLKLGHYPYHSKNGLYGNNTGYVDAVVGFKGVYYPLDKIGDGLSMFDDAADLPDGIFHDDDAYFGICLARMGVPIFAVKPPRRPGESGALRLVSAQGAGESAVQEKAALHRTENEMQIFQHAVTRGWLPGPASRANPDRFLRRSLNRFGLGRKILRWQFNR